MIKKFIAFLSLITLVSILGFNGIQAQSEKKVLGIEDVKLWRSHSVILSDDGQWYTVLYTLREKPEVKQDSTKKAYAEQIFKEFYDENNQTDTLYICNANTGIKYEIKDGKRPVFSAASDWVAYQIKSDKEEPKADKETKEEKAIIELKHLASGFTVKYESNASFSFTEDQNYFISSDKNGLLVYDLDNRREHYIGNIGEYLIDKKTDYIAYTIASEDKRGNGIYLYHPEQMTTRAIQTGNFIFTNLSWNHDNSALVAYKYKLDKDKKVDHKKMSIVLISGIDTKTPQSFEYKMEDVQGMPEQMGPAVKSGRFANEIAWSKDGNRLFIKIKKYDQDKDKKDKKAKKSKNDPTVQVWHWKDKKLLSERMMEEERKQNEVFDAIFFRDAKKIVRITNKEMPRMITSEGTDKWAIGMDNHKYISDWDNAKYDLYRINLTTGDRNLISQKQSGRPELSPDGESMILWDGEHYWFYDLESGHKQNLTADLKVSFIDKEDDHFGFRYDYGFVAWVKNQNAVIVNHKHDLWLLPLDKRLNAKNLTSLGSKKPIRFRFDDLSFKWEEEIEDRYVDLKSSNILYAFNAKTKHAGYYNLQKGKLNKLIYGPASYTSSRWRSGLIKAEKSDAIIYKMGDYQNYPEAYLSNLDFENPKKITNTNPQQKQYKWGHRILIDYTNDDGVPLQGILSIPDDYKKGQKLPMMVYTYEKLSDGMYAYSSPYLGGAQINEMSYVSDGYLFFRPDIHFNVGTPHSDMHESIDAAIEKVMELGYVDENKIGYEGFSYGGHCGMYISTQKNKFAAIAAGAGVSNLVQGFNIDIVRDGSNEQDYYMTSQGRLGTDPTSNTEMYISESAVFNAQGMNTPLLLFHGTADNVVLWEHSFGFYSILRYLKKPVVFLSYEGEGHGLRKKGNRLDIQLRLKEYFDHYLKGKEAGKWITDEIPYKKKEKSKDDKKRTVPIWK